MNLHKTLFLILFLSVAILGCKKEEKTESPTEVNLAGYWVNVVATSSNTSRATYLNLGDNGLGNKYILNIYNSGNTVIFDENLSWKEEDKSLVITFDKGGTDRYKFKFSTDGQKLTLTDQSDVAADYYLEVGK